MKKESDTDHVGYKHPPIQHQFRPGKSGNPNGRPKGSRNFKSDLREELSETISFREGDQEVTISKQRAFIKRLVASAISGDARAIATLMSFCARAFADVDEDDAVQTSVDREIVNAFAAQPTGRRNVKRRTTFVKE